ncbi:MAG: TonB-dependent receptor family protein [Chitinophagales bacterium]|jgi:hypothetical protein|nr:TonB-dependent receptor family protein [Chitinophagales bacterium]
MNHKFLFILIFLIFFQSVLSAQEIQGKVLGLEDKPLPHAKIVLIPSDKSLILSAKSDEKGNFTIVAKAGQLIISLLGYEDYKAQVDDKTQSLNIKLKPNSQLLKSVEIQAMKQRVTLKDDTLEYHAKEFKVLRGSTVEDLVKKLPGVEVQNGTVTAQGEQVRKVTIDGEDFFGDDVMTALRNLPSETVDKVEVFDAMSDQSRFTGFDDGNSQKTINLKTKKEMNTGQFGKIYAGAGTEDTRQLGGTYNFYRDKQRISLLGMHNNINNVNFSSSEISSAVNGGGGVMDRRGNMASRNMNFGMSVAGMSSMRSGGFNSNFTGANQDGINTTSAGGINFTDVLSKKTRLTASIFSNRVENYTKTEINQKNLLNQENTILTNQENIKQSKYFTNKLTSRLEHIFDQNSSFLYTNNLGLNSNNGQNLQQIQNSKNSNELSSFRTSNIEDNFGYNYTGNFLYRQKFKKKGRTLSLNAIVDLNREEGKNLWNNQISFLNRAVQQYSNTLSFAATYTELFKFGQFMLTYSPSITYKKNQIEVFNANSNSENLNLNDQFSSLMRNQFFYNTAGLSFRNRIKALNFLVGVNAQQVDVKIDENTPSQIQTNRIFSYLLPNIELTYRKPRQVFSKFRYTTSINLPSINQFQEVTNFTQINNQSFGNRNLSPEYNHNLFFNLFKPNIPKAIFMGVYLTGNITENSIVNNSTVSLLDTTIGSTFIRSGARYTTYQNYQNRYNASLSGFYSMPITFIKSNLSLNFAQGFAQSPSIFNNLDIRTNSFTTSIGAMITSNFSEKLDFSFGYNPRYIYNTYNQLFPDNDFVLHNLISQLKFILFDRLVFSSDLNYSYNTQIDASLNQHIVLLGASLAYQLLKDKNLELKLSAFDIFNNNRNISRVVNGNFITDTRINAMNQYFMFTTTWNFKKFQGKDPMKPENPFNFSK